MHNYNQANSWEVVCSFFKDNNAYIYNHRKLM